MKINRVVAAAGLALALTAGSASVASAAPAKTTKTVTTTTTTTTVVTVTKTVTSATKKLGSSQVKTNTRALARADRECGAWSATATRKVLDCRWSVLKKGGYVAPKVPAKVYDLGADGPDRGTAEWAQAYGKGFAPDAPPVSDSLAANGSQKPAGR